MVSVIKLGLPFFFIIIINNTTLMPNFNLFIF